VTWHRRLTLRMMSDELNINRRRFVKSSMKIYGRGRYAQCSSHTVSRMSRSSGDPHHAKEEQHRAMTWQVELSKISLPLPYIVNCC
jgi:hypothetical protein